MTGWGVTGRLVGSGLVRVRVAVRVGIGSRVAVGDVSVGVCVGVGGTSTVCDVLGEVLLEGDFELDGVVDGDIEILGLLVALCELLGLRDVGLPLPVGVPLCVGLKRGATHIPSPFHGHSSNNEVWFTVSHIRWKQERCSREPS